MRPSDRLLWRLSIAAVPAAGPFSVFPGYRRIISVLEGDGMVLSVDGARSPELKPFEAFAFDGAAETRCELLGGGIRDFNLIYAADRVTARLRWLALTGSQRVESAAATILVFNAGEAAAVTAGSTVTELGHHDCLRLETAGAPTVIEPAGSADTVCALIEFWMVC